MILPKDHTVRNIISVYKYMKAGKNEQQRIKSFSIIPGKGKGIREETYDIVRIEYEDGSVWTLTSDEFNSIIEDKKDYFDEEFLCIQHLVGLYFKGASAEFIEVFARILKYSLNSDFHDEVSDRMMEAGYRSVSLAGKGGWLPDKVEKLLPPEVIKENKFLRDGRNEWGCYPDD